MSKVISIVNHKGGVGKTTIALNFAAELAKKGHKVLLIDLDSQGNLTEACGLNDLRPEETISEMLMAAMNNKPIHKDNFIHRTKLHDNIDLIPCDITMANAKLALNMAMAREKMLKLALEGVLAESNYDYVIIDNAPSVEVDFQNSLVASDEVLIVTGANKFSESGMSTLLNEMYKIKKYFNSKLKLVGILINKMDARTNFAKDMCSYIKESYSKLNVFDTTIPVSIRAEESQAINMSVADLNEKNPVAVAIKNFVEEYTGGAM